MKKSDIIALTGEDDVWKTEFFSRRRFFKLSAMTVAGLAVAPALKAQEKVQDHKPTPKPPSDFKTNIGEVKDIPKTRDSMPGKYPGKVVKVDTGTASVEGKLDEEKVKVAMEKGLTELTAEKNITDALKQFVTPKDVVGLKVNPIGGDLLSTKTEVTEVLVNGLLAAGVPKANIIIWDRRLFQLEEAGYTAEQFPGISILGTEMKGPNDDFFDENDELWAKDNIVREALPYVADLEMKYPRDTLPYMINEGKESYFTRIVTEKVTKIINVPILKNAGPTVTLCLKNLSYGSISNTSRLHKLWMQSVVEPCAFPVLRDKVVLNVVDGFQACYDGGPGANPKFIYDANVMLFGTDPVAVDAIGHDIIVKERMKRGVQQLDDKTRSAFLEIAESLKLGTADRTKISLKEIALG